MRQTIALTHRQLAFLRSDADETLFGGAAGGGKSYAQLIDAYLYALRYPGSRQLILRRTLPELQRSLIAVSLTLYSQRDAEYLNATHLWRFRNGSVIEFGSCEHETDVTKYQSAEYDVLRFDELTHFSAFQFTYLLSRVRGANGYPKHVKSTTNPGGVGHAWVKERYIDAMPPNTKTVFEHGTRLFLPARVQENCFLMRADAGYLSRLEQLGEDERRALLEGDWELCKGRFFTEFDRKIHVTHPYPLPEDWKRYLAIDYGLDMLAALWIALDHRGRAVVYRELYAPDLIISEAARRIREAEMPGETIYQRLAPPDLWNRRQETGRSAIDLFAEGGLFFERSQNRRVQGWLAVKEYLRPHVDEQGIKTAKLQIFDTCRNLIRTLPALQHDERDPNDVANTPHELTHAPDALRGFAATVFPEGRETSHGRYESEIGAFLQY